MSSACSGDAMRLRTRFVSLTACLVAAAALGAPASVEPFDSAAWERLQQELPRPSAVVFTATYCATCPAVLGKLSEALEKRGVEGKVIAVVIDEAEAGALLQSPHYRHASRLFLFEGNEASLRYRIDPRWRGVTPYIALLSSTGEPLFVAGTPKDEHIAAWLGE